ncbi:MAG TPA: hydroxymethylglutaryl-CoA synthase [Spirochaetia bacterium]|nr:hydroxymethylglutaryl-CoA synthase [Spirochaetia bacterium]
MKTRQDRTVGISDMGLYVPPPEMDVEALVQRRVRDNPMLDRHLQRAGRTTGQTAFRFPELWEDSATLAARSAYELLGRNPDLDMKSLRHLIVGTETGVDHSKPVSAYVQGMLQKAGFKLPTSLSSFQTQHACAGGTFGLLSVAGLLAVGGAPADSGLVLSTDIARYETRSTAEITQGAGAVALLVESSPRLVELDIANLGFCSRDVDDFFRPLGSITARVNGSYSMKCYWESLNDAFLDYCVRTSSKPDETLLSTDYFILHTPFRRMPETALARLFERVLGFDAERTQSFLEEKSFASGVDPLGRIGNIYNGSLFAVLAFLLHERYQALGDGIVGKRLLFASYGSGNTMIVFAGRVAPDAPSVISRWGLDRVLSSARPAGFEEYEAWIAGPSQPELYAELLSHAKPPSGAFVLNGIRKDGYREYAFTGEKEPDNSVPESGAPGDLHRPVSILR